MNVLITRDEIMAYLKISKKAFIKFVKMGMPVVYIDNRCYAHKENIDEFFKKITRSDMSKAPDDILNSEDSKED